MERIIRSTVFDTCCTALIQHQETCLLDKPVKIEYPEEGSTIEFKSHSKREFQAIFGTCDFEASVVPVSRKQNAVKYNCANCYAEGDKKYCIHNTTDCHQQIPTSYSLCLVDKLGTIYMKRQNRTRQMLWNCFSEHWIMLKLHFIHFFNKTKLKQTIGEKKILHLKQLCDAVCVKDIFQIEQAENRKCAIIVTILDNILVQHTMIATGVE